MRVRLPEALHGPRLLPSRRSSLLFRSCNSRSCSITFCLYSSCSWLQMAFWAVRCCGVIERTVGTEGFLFQQQEWSRSEETRNDIQQVEKLIASVAVAAPSGGSGMRGWALQWGPAFQIWNIWRSIKQPSLTYQRNGTSEDCEDISLKIGESRSFSCWTQRCLDSGNLALETLKERKNCGVT